MDPAHERPASPPGSPAGAARRPDEAARSRDHAGRTAAVQRRARTRRPPGVTIIALFIALMGVLSAANVWEIIADTRTHNETWAVFGLVLELALAIASFLAAHGLWKLESYGLTLTKYLIGFYMAITVLGIILGMMAFTGYIIQHLLEIIVRIFIYAIILIYINDRATRQAFR